MCSRVFTLFSSPRWLIDLKPLQVCQFMYMVDNVENTKFLHCHQLLCTQKQIYVEFLN